MPQTHMAAMYVIGRITQRLKDVIKDNETRKQIESILDEELKEVFDDFIATSHY